MTVRMHLTQAERDLIVELCLAATLHQRGEHTAAQETYEQFTAENWEQVRSIIFKLDSPDPDLSPEQTMPQKPITLDSTKPR